MKNNTTYKDGLTKTYNPYYVDNQTNLTPQWTDGDTNGDDNTPIIAEALNQIEMQLKAVYDAVGQIDVDVDSTTPLQSAVTKYKNSVNDKFTKLLDPNDDNGETAKKATSDEEGNNIKATYASSLSESEGTLSLTSKSGADLGSIAFSSDLEQGQIKIGATNIDIKDLQTGSTPTFAAIKLGDDENNTLTKAQYSGNAATASKLQQEIKIILTGDVTGEVDFDGRSNINLPTEITDDSHNHIIDNVDGLEKAIADATTTAQNYADNAITELTTDTITPLTKRVKTIEGKVDALSSATHFLGVKDTLPTIGANGDIVIVGNKEYIYDEASEAEVKWVELGDTTSESQRITSLENSTVKFSNNSVENDDIEEDEYILFCGKAPTQ